MSKVIYDIIQRFEVENGVPRLVSTSIVVIEGGKDLMSLATSMLAQLGFHNKFEENRASQYTGYRLKNPGRGANRYQLVLAQRKEGLCISIPKEILDPYLIYLRSWPWDDEAGEIWDSTKGRFWVLPSKRDIFLNSMNPECWQVLKGATAGIFNYKQMFEEALGPVSKSGSYLVLKEDKLFPYTWQVCVKSSEVLEEFIGHFAKIIMEQQ